MTAKEKALREEALHATAPPRPPPPPPIGWSCLAHQLRRAGQRIPPDVLLEREAVEGILVTQPEVAELGTMLVSLRNPRKQEQEVLNQLRSALLVKEGKGGRLRLYRGLQWTPQLGQMTYQTWLCADDFGTLRDVLEKMDAAELLKAKKKAPHGPRSVGS